MTHRMIMPMNNIVMPWATIAEAIKKRLQSQERARTEFYLDLQPCRELDARIYELVLPDHRLQTMFLLRLVDKKDPKEKDLEVRDVLQARDVWSPSDFDAHQTLQLVVHVHWSGDLDIKEKNTTAMALFRARQTYDGFYQFMREHRFKTINIKNKRKVDEKKNKIVDDVVAQKRLALVEQLDGMTIVDEKTFIEALNCALNLPRDARLYVGPFSLDKKFFQCEGERAIDFPSYKEFKKLMIMSRVRSELLDPKNTAAWKKSSFPSKAWRDTFEDSFQIDGKEATEAQKREYREELLRSDDYLTDLVSYDDDTVRKTTGKIARSDAFLRQRYNTFIMNQYIMRPQLPNEESRPTFKDAQPLMQLDGVSREARTKQMDAVQYIKEHMEHISRHRTNENSIDGPGLDTVADRQLMVNNFTNLHELYGKGLRFNNYMTMFRQLTAPRRGVQPSDVDYGLQTIDNLMKAFYCSKDVRQWNDDLGDFYDALGTSPTPLDVFRRTNAQLSTPQLDKDLRSMYGALFPACQPLSEQPRDVMGALKKRLRELEPQKYAQLLHVRQTIVTAVRNNINTIAGDAKSDAVERLYAAGLDATLVPNLSEQKAFEYLERHIAGTNSVRTSDSTPDSLADVASFFGLSVLPSSANPTVRLFSSMPLNDCMWDWEPVSAVVRKGHDGQQVWANYTRTKNGVRETTTVIWQKSRGNAQLKKQNQVRLLAASQGKGANIIQAFTETTRKGIFEALQTRESVWVQATDHTALNAAEYTPIDFLQQKGPEGQTEIVGFNFLIDDNARVLDLAQTDRTLWEPQDIGGCLSWEDIRASYDTCTLSQANISNIFDILIPRTTEQEDNVETQRQLITVELQKTTECTAVHTLLNTTTSKFHLFPSFPDLESIAWRGGRDKSRRFFIWSKWNANTTDVWLHPQRQYDKLKKLEAHNLTFPPLMCAQTGESMRLTHMRWHAQNVPVFGDQYWTITMDNNSKYDFVVPLGWAIECYHLLAVGVIAEAIVGLLDNMRLNAITHGSLSIQRFVLTSISPKKVDVLLTDLGFIDRNEPWLDARTFIFDCELIIKSDTKRSAATRKRYQTIVDAIQTYYQSTNTSPFAVAALQTSPDEVEESRKRYLNAETRRAGSVWCNKYNLPIPPETLDSIAEFQEQALELFSVDKKSKKSSQNGSNVDKFPNVVRGVRPAFLVNMKAQSCYFTVFMLMLYQMSDVVETLTDCPTQSEDVDQIDIIKKRAFIENLNGLLATMRQNDIVGQSVLSPIYNASREAFPDNGGVEGGRQQGQRDASELMSLVLNCSADPSMITIQWTETTITSNVPIRNLICGDRKIPPKARDDFEPVFQEEMKNSPVEKGAHHLLRTYTFRDEKIQKKLDDVPRQCGVESATYFYRDRDGDSIDWSDKDFTSKVQVRSDSTLRVKEYPAYQDLCPMVENYVKLTHTAYGAETLKADDLYFSYVRKQKKYTEPTSKYLYVSFSYDYLSLSNDATFSYETQFLEFEQSAYDLVAVCHHTGGISGGHYYTSLKIENVWYKYDDIRGIRQPAAISTTDNPTALLFEKRMS